MVSAVLAAAADYDGSPQKVLEDQGYIWEVSPLMLVAKDDLRSALETLRHVLERLASKRGWSRIGENGGRMEAGWVVNCTHGYTDKGWLNAVLRSRDTNSCQV
jgi:hypothetical protein